MVWDFKPVGYARLNSRERETYNFQKVSGLLADYGFVTMKLNNDWHGADFLAHNRDGRTLKVQLKGRLTFRKEYSGKNLWICFCEKGRWYFYPHDELKTKLIAHSNRSRSKSWKKKGGYSMPYLTKELKRVLGEYEIRPVRQLRSD